MKRIAWIDWSKCILIYLVVVAHYGNIPTVVDNWICAFHMPAFFMISGYLHKELPLWKSLTKNAKRLLVPALLFSIVCWAHNVAFDFLRHNPLTVEEDIIKPSLGLVRYDRPNVMPPCGVIWFIEVLFICKLLIDFILKFKSRQILYVVVLICATATSVIYKMGWNDTSWPFLFQRTFASFPFVAIGFIAKGQGWINRFKDKNCLTVILTLLYMIGVWVNGRVGIATWRFGHDVLLYYVIAFIGCFSFFLLVNKIKTEKIATGGGNLLVTISNGTITILCLHRLMIPYFKYIDIGAFIGSFLIICICYPIILFLDKYIPWFVGRNRQVNQ